MSVYAFPFFHHVPVFAGPTLAADGNGIPNPGDLLTNPYGFLIVIFSCAFWGLREWRKGRELDVENYKRRAIEAEGRADALESKNNEETSLLSTKVEALQSDIRALRDQHFREQESQSAKYYAARQMLLASGIPKKEIP